MTETHISKDAKALSRATAEALEKLCSETLSPGLYLVATPIGNLADVTLRALAVMAKADHLYCEDTRHSQKLLSAYAIRRPLQSYHEHNAERLRPAILGQLRQGASVALISDAGTPLIADPGYKLVREAIDSGIGVHPIPGPSAAISALVASGLPSDSFFFAGFLPPKQAARRKKLERLKDVPGTIVLFESPNRLQETLEDILKVLGDRPAALLRELTKRHEQLVNGPVSAIWEQLTPEEMRGEMVVVLAEAKEGDITTLDLEKALAEELATGSLRDAVASVADRFNVSRKSVYDIALKLREKM